MKKVSYLTVVMPAYNEGKIIKDNLLKAAAELETFAPDFQIIAVNDGSSDNTRDEMLKAREECDRIHVISYKTNRGKGHAIKRGFLASDTEYTAFLDSDLELPPYLLADFLKTIEDNQADVVIGSKMHKDSKIEYPLSRKIMSFGYYVILRVLFNLKLKDTQTGIKLFRTDKIKPIMGKLRNGGFSFDIEILARAAKENLVIMERPVTLVFSRGKNNKSKISVKQIVKMFVDTVKIKTYLKNN